jgi:metal transporter CNNM
MFHYYFSSFAEIIPQSVCTRHGLYIGAKMADFTQILIYVLVSLTPHGVRWLCDAHIQAIVAWPVAKVLEFVLGPHHGIVYRRAELKELIAMHSVHGTHGGDLTSDTVSVVQATIDLQGKAVEQVHILSSLIRVTPFKASQ